MVVGCTGLARVFAAANCHRRQANGNGTRSNSPIDCEIAPPDCGLTFIAATFSATSSPMFLSPLGASPEDKKVSLSKERVARSAVTCSWVQRDAGSAQRASADAAGGPDLDNSRLTYKSRRILSAARFYDFIGAKNTVECDVICLQDLPLSHFPYQREWDPNRSPGDHTMTNFRLPFGGRSFNFVQGLGRGLGKRDGGQPRNFDRAGAASNNGASAGGASSSGRVRPGGEEARPPVAREF